MFSQNRKIEPAAPAPVPPTPRNGTTPLISSGAILSSGVSITGSVKFKTEMVIDGNVEGSIDSAGRLTVGKNAHIRAEISLPFGRGPRNRGGQHHRGGTLRVAHRLHIAR